MEEELLRNKFFNSIDRFISAGFVKEVYDGSYFTILNFGDMLYLGCPYNLIDDKLAAGMLLTGKNVEAIVEDEDLLSNMIEHRISNNTFNQHSFVFNDYNYSICAKTIEQMKKQGKWDYIDLNMEERIQNKRRKM